MLSSPLYDTNAVTLASDAHAAAPTTSGQYEAVRPARCRRWPEAVTGAPWRAGRAGLETKREKGVPWGRGGRRERAESGGGVQVYWNLE